MTVKKVAEYCREHMICPLPRAREMSALRMGRATGRGTEGGADGLRRGRHGAGHEAARGHLASIEWSDQLAASGGHPRACIHAACAAGGRALRPAGPSPSTIGAAGAPRAAKRPPTRCSASCACIASGFAGWNVRHFYRFARRDHAVTLSYSFVKLALQEAGLVRKGRARGRHRRRREPRGCFGELLHLDGSPHPWLRLAPTVRATLIAVLDDATTQLLYAQLWPAETTAAVFSALHAVFTTWGLPIALYTDRAHWAFHTPKAGGPSIAPTSRRSARPSSAWASSTSARTPRRPGAAVSGSIAPSRAGSSTSSRLEGITTLAAANTYLAERFMADYNAEFARPPAEAATAFVPLHGVDLEAILCEHAERSVGQDNVVTLDTLALQIAKQPGRPTCAGLRVTVRRALDGHLSVWHGARCFGRYDAQGRPLPADRPKNARAHLAPPRSSASPGSALPVRRRRARPRLPIGRPD